VISKKTLHGHCPQSWQSVRPPTALLIKPCYVGDVMTCE